MGRANRKPDLAREVAQLRKDVKRLQQRRSLTYVEDRPSFPTGIQLGGVPFGAGEEGPPPPTDLVLAWRAFHNEVSIDASWTAPPDNVAGSYEVELWEVIGPDPLVDLQLVDVRVVIGTDAVLPALPATDYVVRVFALDQLSRRSVKLEGAGATGSDSTVPAAPTGVVVTAGLRTVVVSWDEVDDGDVALGAGLYEVDLATAADFSTGLRTERTSSTIIPFADLPAGAQDVTWYARVRAVDSSGNEGPSSATASSAAAGVSSDDVVLAGLSAAVIKFGEMSGDRIAANTLSAGSIKTSTLGATVITIGAGGRLQVGSGAPGVFIDDQGIRAWDASAVRTFWLNGATGAVELVGGVVVGAAITGGTFRTAGSGKRIELTGTDVGRVAFYSGNIRETNGPGEILMYDSTVNHGRIEMHPPHYSGQGAPFLLLQSWSGGTASALVQLSVRDTAGATLGGQGSFVTYMPATIHGDTMVDLRNAAGTANGIVKTVGTTPPSLAVGAAGGNSAAFILTAHLGTNEVRCQDLDATGYRPCRASSFPTGSDEALKAEIQPLDADPRDTVTAIAQAARRYRLRGPKGKAIGPQQVGLVANLLPAPVRADDEGSAGYDLNAVATVTAVEVERLGTQLAWLIDNAVIRPDAAARPTR